MKVVKKILDLEFIEMSEVTIDDDMITGPGRPAAPARLPVTEISQWLERYSLVAAILSTRFPEKAPELFAYQRSIVRVERNYEGKQWVAYDRQYRREALAHSTGRQQTLASTTRHSPEGPDLSRGVPSASRMTTPQQAAHGTQTAQCLDGSRPRGGHIHHRGPLPKLTVKPRNQHRRSATGLTRGRTSNSAVTTGTPVQAARGRTPSLTALRGNREKAVLGAVSPTVLITN